MIRSSAPARKPQVRLGRISVTLALCLATLAAATPSPPPSDSRPTSPAPSASLVPSGSPAPSPATNPPASSISGVRPLVFAYYYIWYSPTSWRRAKTDLPQLGRYDSRDRAVIAQHIAWAHDAGIDGLIVSWKHEQRLDDALRVLVEEATKAGMKLVLLYQGLDFNRLPLDDAVVATDMTWFLDNYATAAPFNVFGLPTIIWSGTWGYKDGQLDRVRTAIGAPVRALLLGSERSAAAYTSRARFFDGDAYYWSSPDPLSTPGYQRRLDELAAAVRVDAGRWVAPAAPGFDARLIGGTSIVPRRDGATYRAAWNGALETSPDILGIISWNEFSENSYLEPSQTYARAYLDLTAGLVAALPSTGSPAEPSQAAPGTPKVGTPSVEPSPPAVDRAPEAGATNLWGVAAAVSIVIALALVGRVMRRRSAE